MEKRKEILEELREIAGEWKDTSGKLPYTLPNDYFETLPDQILLKIKDLEIRQVPIAELKALSPRLAELPKTVPFHVPGDYFEGLVPTILARVKGPSVSKTFGFRRSSFRWQYALAASVITVVLGSSLLFFHQNSMRNLDGQLAKVSDQEIMEYLENHSDVFDNEVILKNLSEKSLSAENAVQELPNDQLQKYLEDHAIVDDNSLN